MLVVMKKNPDVLTFLDRVSGGWSTHTVVGDCFHSRGPGTITNFADIKWVGAVRVGGEQ